MIKRGRKEGLRQPDAAPKMRNKPKINWGAVDAQGISGKGGGFIKSTVG